VSESLVYRYNVESPLDGFEDSATFSICTFWYVEALASAQATPRGSSRVFEKMLTYVNHSDSTPKR
jgi:GH15 family glucan-1,4-alpha-glucosidase